MINVPFVTRRSFLTGFTAAAIAPATFAQESVLRLRKLNCFEIRVSDVEASVGFYQDLFGLPVQWRSADRVCLRIGAGPQFMRIRAAARGEQPAITHIGYSVDDYDPLRVSRALEDIGFGRIEPPPPADDGIDHAMKTWLRTVADTPEIYFADNAGLIVQLSDPMYCGGGGVAGNRCGPIEMPPAGPMRLADLNHFTVFLNDGAAANLYYQETFGLSVQAYQGQQAPVTGIGDGYQFVMYAGPGRADPVPANIHHACFSMPDFSADQILETLTEYGLTARGEDPIGPLMHYVSLRMPERGGAEGGTPELYFTDPDGILLQLQDVSYCGGGGYLGDECLN